MSKKRSERGYAVVWVIVTIALLAAGISSIEFTVERSMNPWMIVIFCLSLPVALGGLYIEAKRDFYAFCGGAILFGSITAMITGAVAAVGQDPHPVAAVVSIATASFTLFCLGYMLKTQYTKEWLSNLVRSEFHRSAIYEIDGVQFATTQSQSELTSGQTFEINLVAQNCWDTERTITLELEAERRLSFNKAGLRFEKISRLVLPGGAAGVLTVPVVAQPGARGRYGIVAKPTVEGEGGLRVLRWRAQPLSSRLPAWVTALGAIGGLLVWGGGLTFKAAVARPAENEQSPAEIVLEPDTEIVFTPERTQLSAAARGA